MTVIVWFMEVILKLLVSLQSFQTATGTVRMSPVSAATLSSSIRRLKSALARASSLCLHQADLFVGRPRDLVLDGLAARAMADCQALNAVLR